MMKRSTTHLQYKGNDYSTTEIIEIFLGKSAQEVTPPHEDHYKHTQAIHMNNTSVMQQG